MLAQVTIEELGKAIRGPKPPKIIDVREPEEFAKNHIPGAQLIPLATLAREIENRVPNKLEPVVLYDNLGIRSHHAARLLRSMGYQQVREVAGGLRAYVSRGGANS